jgi:hypothetical protein
MPAPGMSAWLIDSISLIDYVSYASKFYDKFAIRIKHINIFMEDKPNKKTRIKYLGRILMVLV